MSKENIDRILRIKEIITKYENEINLLNNYLENPFSRGDQYFAITKSQSYIDDNSKRYLSILIWVLNFLLWGILVFGFSNIKTVIIEVVLFTILSLAFIYIGTTIRLFFFCKRRKKELKNLIFANQNKLHEIEENTDAR